MKKKDFAAKEIECTYRLLEAFGVSKEILECVTALNGLTIETLNDICYYEFGLPDCRELLLIDDLSSFNKQHN